MDDRARNDLISNFYLLCSLGDLGGALAHTARGAGAGCGSALRHPACRGRAHRRLRHRIERKRHSEWGHRGRREWCGGGRWGIRRRPKLRGSNEWRGSSSSSWGGRGGPWGAGGRAAAGHSGQPVLCAHVPCGVGPRTRAEGMQCVRARNPCRAAVRTGSECCVQLPLCACVHVCVRVCVRLLHSGRTHAYAHAHTHTQSHIYTSTYSP